MLERKKWPSVLGPETSIDCVKDKYYALKTDQEVPHAKDLAPYKPLTDLPHAQEILAECFRIGMRSVVLNVMRYFGPFLLITEVNLLPV
ncbi:MAG: hypothetical protein SV375_07775 [Thermodesulfobacteriota bacterium]|nr:hypothetical protein [Thermodesulfobacteriota bacterium]